MEVTSNEVDYDELKKYVNASENFKDLPVDIDEEFLVEDKNNLADLELLDETIVQIKEDARLQHPTKIVDGKIADFPVCETSTGKYGCCANKISDSDLIGFGPGVISFFKTLKAYIIVFLVISIIHTPVFIIYTQSNPNKKILGYNDLFYKTTIGNIASRLSNCQELPLYPELTFNFSSLKMDCRSYTLQGIEYFGVSPDLATDYDNRKSCQMFSLAPDIALADNCTSFINNLTALAFNCTDNEVSNCEIQINNTEFRQQCSVDYQPTSVFFSYSCYNKDIPLIVWKLNRRTASFIIVAIDIASVFIILIAIFVIEKGTSKVEIVYKQSVNHISDYTIHISMLNFKDAQMEDEFSELLQHLEKAMHIERPKVFNSNITNFYDINYPIVSDSNLDIILEQQKMADKIKKIKKSLINPSIKEGEKTKLQAKLEKKRDKYLKLGNSLGNEQEIGIISDVWITFNRMKYARKIVNTFSKYSKCDRCCLIFFCQRSKFNHL